MRMRIPRRIALPVIAVALVVLATVIPRPSAPLDRPRPIELDAVAYLCPSWPGLAVQAGQMDPGAGATARALPDAAVVAELEDAERWRSAEPRGDAVVVEQRGPGSGAAGFLVGRASGRGDGLAVAGCPTLTHDAWFSGLAAVDGHDSELVIANPGPDDAVVTLAAWSSVGSIEVPEGDGMAIAPGEVRRVAASDLAAGEDPLTVRVSRQRGVVVAMALDSVAGGGSELVVGATAPAREQVLAGIPAQTDRRLLLTNPGDATANVEISVLTTEGAPVVEGLDDVAVAPGTVQAVPIPGEAAAGAAIRLRSSEPITGLLRAQGAEDFAVSEPLWRLRQGHALLPVVGDTQVTVAAAEDTRVGLEVFDAEGASLGREDVDVAAGTSRAIAVADVAAGGAYAALRSEGGVYAAARYSDGAGIASLPLRLAPVDALAPAVSWGGRWH